MSHLTPHTPVVHDASPFAGAGHARPHTPQCCRLICRSAQVPPQSDCPPEQPDAQTKLPALIPQTSVGEHGVAHAPQCAGLERSASQPLGSLPSPLPSQSACVSRHTVPQLTPSQVARVFGGTGHGMHEPPHEPMSLSARHASPQRWRFGGQSMPHSPAAQAAAAPGGAGQDLHAMPQLSASSSATQTPAQSW